MQTVLLAALLACALLACVKAPQVSVQASTRVIPTVLVVGEPGVVILQLHATKGYHVSPELPQRVRLAGSPSLTLGLTELASDQAETLADGGLSWTIPVVSRSPGESTLRAIVDGYACSTTACVPGRLDLTLPVRARRHPRE